MGASAMCCSCGPFSEGGKSGLVLTLLSFWPRAEVALALGSFSFVRPFLVHFLRSVTMSFRPFLSLALVAFFFAATSSNAALVILKDHVSDMGLWNGKPLISHNYDVGLPELSRGAAAAFIGDGSTLKSVGGIFAHDSLSGVPNGGDPTELDFRFAFYDSVSSYVADPFMETPMLPDVFHEFTTVSNAADLLAVVGQSADGHDLFYWELDVEFLGIQTTPGKTQLVSLIPEGNSFSGATQMAFSVGGGSAIGSEHDFYRSGVLDIGPDTLPNLGAPHGFAAYRVTGVSDVTGPPPVPEQRSLLVWAAVFTAAWVSRRLVGTGKSAAKSAC